MGKLTAAKVKSLTKQGLHGDGGTLYLAVAKGGSKSWIQRVTIDGKRHDIGLGGYPYVGLAAARQKAMDNRTAIAAGRNPITEKRRSSIPTFALAARRAHAMLKPSWSGDLAPRLTSPAHYRSQSGRPSVCEQIMRRFEAGSLPRIDGGDTGRIAAQTPFAALAHAG